MCTSLYIVLTRMILHAITTSVICVFKSMLKIWRGFRKEPENELKTRDNVPQLKEINLFSL